MMDMFGGDGSGDSGSVSATGGAAASPGESPEPENLNFLLAASVTNNWNFES